MRTKKVTQGLGALFVVVLTVFASACATTDSSRSPSASPSPSASAPSKAEVAAAIKLLAPAAGFHYTIKLSPKPEDFGGFATIAIFKLEQDASGRWQASAHLIPPGMASSLPANIILVKYPEGWRIVSMKAVAYQQVPGELAGVMELPE